MIKQLLEDLMRSQQANKGAIHLSCGHYYGSEPPLHVANDLAAALKPITGGVAAEQGGYAVYPNVPTPVLSKPHALNGLPEDQSNTNGNVTPAFQQALQQKISSVLPVNHAILNSSQHVAPFIGAQLIHSIPQHTAVIQNQTDVASTANNLAKQLSANQTLSLPLQYIPVVQTQAGQPTVSAQGQAIHNVVQYPAQFLSQHVLQHLQPIYAHQLQQNPAALPSVLTQVNPNLQQPVLAQSLVQGVVAQNLISSAIVPQPRQQPRIVEHRNNTVFAPAQTAQSNNSNNAVFSRSTSRVDETSSAFTPVVTNGNDVDAGTFSAPPPTPTGSEQSFKAL